MATLIVALTAMLIVMATICSGMQLVCYRWGEAVSVARLVALIAELAEPLQLAAINSGAIRDDIASVIGITEAMRKNCHFCVPPVEMEQTHMGERSGQEAMTAKYEELIGKINHNENRFCVDCNEDRPHTFVMRREVVWTAWLPGSKQDITFAWKCHVCEKEVGVAMFRF